MVLFSNAGEHSAGEMSVVISASKDRYNDLYEQNSF